MFVEISEGFLILLTAVLVVAFDHSARYVSNP